MGKQTEQCGRCAMSSVVDFTENGGDEDEEAAARAARNPFGGDRIEVDDDELRAMSPGAWLGGLKSRLDDVATRLTYGR